MTYTNKTCFWLSFGDDSRPEGARNIGCTIVEADSMTEAIIKSQKLEINPGGEIMAIEFKFDGTNIQQKEMDFMLNKLGTKEEMEEIGMSLDRRDP